MTRKEYELIFQAFNSYRPFMTDAEEVLSEKILDDLFYPHFDKLSTDDSEINTDWQPDDTFDDTFDEIVADAEEALANESGIKSLNFRS